MNSTKIESIVQKKLEKLLQDRALVKKIVAGIVQLGGQAILVGGAVRDLLLSSTNNLEIKDLDIEVYNLTLEQLQAILEQFGPVSLVGKSFGVLRVHHLDIDWSLPRADSAGRHPHVIIDPFMSVEKSFLRRDLTINAMGIDLHTFELIDPCNGLQDLKNKLLRAPDAHLFVQDPLRLFRVMQFIARLQMQPDATLNKVCATMDMSAVSIERIELEFDKMFLKSERPSLGIRWLREINRLKEILPELADTIGIEQDPIWHPEGDVFEHTMQAIDAAALLSYGGTHEKLIASYAVLCHDLGKVTTTQFVDGRVRSRGHDQVGGPLARKMLKRITHRKELVDAVVKLVVHHMAPGQFVENNAKAAAYKRLALKLAPEVNLQLLAKVSLADKRGRNPRGHLPLANDIPNLDEFCAKSQKAHVFEQPEKPLLQGKDLMGIIEPGPKMGALLKKAYEIQIEEDIQDKQELLKRILK